VTAQVRRIAIVAPPWYPVPPSGYGGIEVVVAMLTVELRAAGLDVALIGSEGSLLATHVAAPRDWSRDLGGGAREHLREVTYAGRVVRALESMGRLDVIHDHCGRATLFATALTRLAPVVHTVHGVLGEPEHTLYAAMPETAGLVAISDGQRSSAPSLPWVARVYNAVDVDGLCGGAGVEREPYLLCLARICADKGQHVAIEVAQRAGMRLILAGKVEATQAGHDYYERCISPFLDGDRIIHVCNVAGATKARLLARATALLAPLQWDEPFGLALVEAMASGTPAIAFPRGATPELITPGVTGFLVDDAEGMVAAVADAVSVDHVRCADVARARFSPAAMAGGYRAAYECAAVAA
jgi:glycosyltransferase involved in cell wall biosynthesis